MAITADLGGTKYTLGRGRVFFDRYAPNVAITADTVGEGERFIGNAPEFSTSSSSQTLDHYASTGGIKVKDNSVQLSLDRSGKFKCDNIDAENVALYFLGDAGTLTQTANASIVQLTTVKKGRFYQLGLSATLPTGHRKVTVATVKSGALFATTHVDGTDYQVDTDLGRIYIPEGSSIADLTQIQVTYATAATTVQRVVSSSNSVYGAVRFVSDNPQGENRDFYLPYVKISPDGDYSLIGDAWQEMSFTMEILKKSSNVESMYITSRPT